MGYLSRIFVRSELRTSEVLNLIWLSGIKQEIQFPGESQDIGNFSGFASGLYDWQGMCVGSMVSWQTCKFCLLQLSVFLNGAS